MSILRCYHQRSPLVLSNMKIRSNKEVTVMFLWYIHCVQVHCTISSMWKCQLTSACTSICAPFCSKRFTTSICPFQDATYSAVTPFCQDIVRYTKPLFSIHLKTHLFYIITMNALKFRTLSHTMREDSGSAMEQFQRKCYPFIVR